jgi:hypothetical protein
MDDVVLSEQLMHVGVAQPIKRARGNDDSGMEADRGSSNFLRQDDKTTRHCDAAVRKLKYPFTRHTKSSLQKKLPNCIINMATQRLHGSCACGRNRYVVELPAQQRQQAELRYDNTSASRRC